MTRANRALPTIERLQELLHLGADGVLRWRVTRGNVRAGQPAFTSMVIGGQGRRYHHGRIDSVSLTRGRVVFALTHGRWPDGEVRRLDGDSLNDDVGNLVDTWTDPRGRGRGRTAARGSRFIGVTWSADRELWAAKRHVDGTVQRLGYYATEEEAARAYDASAPVTGTTYGDLRNFPVAQP